MLFSFLYSLLFFAMSCSFNLLNSLFRPVYIVVFFNLNLILALLFDSNYTPLVNVFYFQMSFIKIYYLTEPRHFFLPVSSRNFRLIRIAYHNNFFVLFLVLFVLLNYIELHHFNLVICLSFNTNVSLQSLCVRNTYVHKAYVFAICWFYWGNSNYKVQTPLENSI